MNTLQMVINVAALAASITALVISARLAGRQAQLLRQSNQIPVILEHFRQLRSDGFIRREFTLREKIKEYPTSAGFSGLPEPLRTEAYEIVLFYHDTTYMIRHGGIDEELMGHLHYRLRRTNASRWA